MTLPLTLSGLAQHRFKSETIGVVRCVTEALGLPELRATPAGVLSGTVARM